MTAKKLFMALVVMLVTGVQGYAQYLPYRPAPMSRYVVPPRLTGFYEVYPGWERPKKAEIENVIIKRLVNNKIRITILNEATGKKEKKYMHVADLNYFKYTCPSGTFISITTGNIDKNGRAYVRVYVHDIYGNSTTCTL